MTSQSYSRIQPDAVVIGASADLPIHTLPALPALFTRAGATDGSDFEEEIVSTTSVAEPETANPGNISEQQLLEQLPQVKYIARRIHERLPKHVPFDDLVHAGIVGLIDAMHKFDAGKNVRFSSYAKFRIRGAILDSLRLMDWSPRDLRRKARAVDAARQKLQSELGRSPTEPELADEMGLNLEEFQQLLNDIRGLDVGSLQMESFEDGHEADLAETLPDPASVDPLQLCIQGERKQMLAEAIAQLNPRDQQVLSLYYHEELTMKEVGAVLGVGESRVSQLHSAALARLRTLLSRRQRVPAAVLTAAQSRRQARFGACSRP